MTALPLSLAPLSAADQAATAARIITDAGDFDRLEEQWHALFDASPTAAPPLRFQWLRQWWRIYGPTYAQAGPSLRIFTVQRDGRLIGALPLYAGVTGHRALGLRRLGFISTGEAEIEETCPDYMDLLHLPGEEQTCLDAILPLLLKQDWDELDLSDLSPRSPLLKWTSDQRCRWGRKIAPRGDCPIADISGGLDAYLMRLSANTRQQGRRLLRAAEKAGATFQLARQPREVESFFDDLVRLHQQRWAGAGARKSGVFISPRFTELHRTLARLWVPAGKAELARLSVAGQPLAVIYGFNVGSKFDFYQSGVARDESSPLKSPGVVAFLLLMADLARRGATTFDFLRGASNYKQRLATGHCPLYRLRVLRPGWRSGTWTLMNLAQRALGKAGRLLRRACAAPRPPSQPMDRTGEGPGEAS